jgi:hypothetical protein
LELAHECQQEQLLCRVAASIRETDDGFERRG